MMNRRYVLTVSFLLMIAAGVTIERRRASGAKTLTLLATQGRAGNLVACGCDARKLGGVEREANLLSYWRKSLKTQSLLMSTGRVFAPEFPSELITGTQEYSKRSEALVKAMNEMGVEIVSPSPIDYALGIAEINRLRKLATFRLVSANLYHVSGEPLLDRYAKFSYGGQSVIVTGVTHIDAEGFNIDPEVRVEPAREALDRLFRELPAADFVVLLSDLEAEDRNYLIRNFPQIRVVIGGKGIRTTESAVPFNGNTLVMSLAEKGVELGRIDLAVGGRGIPFFNEEMAKFIGEERDWRREQVETLQRRALASGSGNLELRVNEYKSYLLRTESIPLRRPKLALDYQSEVVQLTETYAGENRVSKMVGGEGR